MTQRLLARMKLDFLAFLYLLSEKCLNCYFYKSGLILFRRKKFLVEFSEKQYRSKRRTRQKSVH